MKHVFIALVATLALAWFGLNAHATWYQLSATSVTYSGPGDVVSGASFWFGLRGYNAAFSGSVANICDNSTGTTCADATWSGSTLTIPTTPYAGTPCDNSTHKCTVKILYDQSGATACNGLASNCTVSQATLADRPILVMPGTANGCPTTSFPCMDFSGVSTAGLQSATAYNTGGVTQPISISAVFVQATTTAGDIMNVGGNSNVFFTVTNTPATAIFAGTNLTISTVVGTWYGVQTYPNGASSLINANNGALANTGAAGGGNAEGTVQVGWDTFNGPLPGKMVEIGAWGNITFTAPQIAALAHNQCTYWAFTSC